MMKRTATKKIALLLSVTLLCSMVSACGWRLRGSGGSLDIQQMVYLEGPDGQVYEAIKKNLTQKQRLGDIANADIQLILGEEFYERRSATVDNSLRTIQYQLTFSVSYEILNNLGQPLAEKSNAELSRYYTYDQNAINSSEKEEQALRKEIIRQLSQRILRRVNFVSQKAATE